jgi:hypothetical protein
MWRLVTPVMPLMKLAEKFRLVGCEKGCGGAGVEGVIESPRGAVPQDCATLYDSHYCCWRRDPSWRASQGGGVTPPRTGTKRYPSPRPPLSNRNALRVTPNCNQGPPRHRTFPLKVRTRNFFHLAVSHNASAEICLFAV